MEARLAEAEVRANFVHTLAEMLWAAAQAPNPADPPVTRCPLQ